MEQEFGIEEYVDGQKIPIPCILKQLYTDFIVQEIGENNEELSIRPKCSEKSVQVKESNFDVPAPECLTADVLAELEKYVSALGEKSKEVFPINTKGFSKEERTSIHKFIRQRFADTLNTELKGDDIVVTSSSGDRNARKRKRWSPDNPDFLHFTMAKENKDTAYALGIVAKFIGVKPDLFRTCGIKDKRAVTSQKVSCYRVEKEKLIKIVPRLRDFTLFDFEYKKEGLKMGGHWGNRFNLILRNVPTESREDMAERCELFKSKGFVNYFGTQRFGSSLNNTAKTGRLIIQRKWEEAVKNIMKITAEMGNTTVSEAAAHFLENGDAQSALKKLKGGQAFASTESNILRALSRGRTWQQCLTEVLPVNIRSLYVHAYQSLIWNKLVTRRIQEFGCEAVTEDVGKDGNWLTDGNIYSAYLPLPGSDLKLFPEYAKKWLEELLAEDGLTNESFVGLRDRFSLGDTSRPLLVLPGNVQYEFISYSQPREVLQDGLIDRKEQKKEGDSSGDLLALKIQFNLPNGVYATVALRQVTGYDMGRSNMAEAGKELLAAEGEEIAEDELQNDGEAAEPIS